MLSAQQLAELCCRLACLLGGGCGCRRVGRHGHHAPAADVGAGGQWRQARRAGESGVKWEGKSGRAWDAEPRCLVLRFSAAPVGSLVWHHKGDYLGTVVPTAASKQPRGKAVEEGCGLQTLWVAVCVGQVSQGKTQCPFRQTHGQVGRVDESMSSASCCHSHVPHPVLAQREPVSCALDGRYLTRACALLLLLQVQVLSFHPASPPSSSPRRYATHAAPLVSSL